MLVIWKCRHWMCNLLSCATRPIMQQELTSTFLNVFTYSTEASVLKFGELSNWVIFSRRIKYILTNFFNVTKNNWTSIVSDYIWYVSKILFFFPYWFQLQLHFYICVFLPCGKYHMQYWHCSAWLLDEGLNQSKSGWFLWGASQR